MSETALLAEAGPETATLGMVAVYPRVEEARALAVEDGLAVDDLHVTLVFLGEANDINEEAVTSAVDLVAQSHDSLEGAVGGVGHFAAGEEGIPIIVMPDVRGLTNLRERIVAELDHSGIQSPSEHGFLPHMTLTYGETAAVPEESVIGQELHFDAISVVVGDRRTDYPLGGAMSAATTVSVTVGDQEEMADAEPIAWEGVLAVEGIPTDDSTQTPRILMPESLSWRELPIPLMVQLETAEGHAGAQLGGQIQEIWRKKRPDLGEQAVAIMARGFFTANEFGQEAARLVGEKSLRGVSVDLVGTTWALAAADTHELVDEAELDFERLMAGEFLLALTEGDIGAATVTPLQALADATISLVASGVESTTFASTFGIHLVGPMVAGEGLTAAAPTVHSRSAYERPEADQPTPLTITEDREIFGHAFLWDTCHTGFADRCVTAPRSPSDYAFFHLGLADTSEGEEIAVGQITLDTGHADLRAGRNATRRHYDNTGVAAADVRIEDGVLGGWISGTLRDIPEEDARKLKAAKLSGDWRSVNGRLDLIGLLAVNVPGFPVPRPEARLVASAEGEQICALVAAGIPDEDEERLSLLVELLADPGEMTFLVTELVGWEDDFAYSAEERRRMAKDGRALKDGSFPIANCADAEKAIHSQGRAADQDAAVRHIRKRVRALDCSGSIFEKYQ